MALLTYVGILFGYITGTYLSYYDVPKVPLLLPIVFFVIFWFFPETHQYYMARNNIEVRKQLKPNYNESTIIMTKYFFYRKPNGRFASIGIVIVQMEMNVRKLMLKLNVS